LEGLAFLGRLVAHEGLELRLRERPRHAVAYAKSADSIAGLLALAGASDCALAIQEHAVVAAARATANRLANADHANLVRASRAAHEQLRAVRRLERAGRLAALSPALQEMAELRRRHPALS